VQKIWVYDANLPGYRDLDFTPKGLWIYDSGNNEWRTGEFWVMEVTRTDFPPDEWVYTWRKVGDFRMPTAQVSGAHIEWSPGLPGSPIRLRLNWSNTNSGYDVVANWYKEQFPNGGNGPFDFWGATGAVPESDGSMLSPESSDPNADEFRYVYAVVAFTNIWGGGTGPGYTTNMEYLGTH
jgi:hypothetical protein